MDVTAAPITLPRRPIRGLGVANVSATSIDVSSCFPGQREFLGRVVQPSSLEHQTTGQPIQYCRSMSNPTTGQPRPQTQIPVTPAFLIFAAPLLSLLISCERSHPVVEKWGKTGGERYSLLLDQTGTRNSTHDQLFECKYRKEMV
jgi:hypothetical protein